MNKILLVIIHFLNEFHLQAEDAQKRKKKKKQLKLQISTYLWAFEII